MSDFMTRAEDESRILKDPVRQIAEGNIKADNDLIPQILRLLREDYRLAKELGTSSDLLEPYRRRAELKAKQIHDCLTGQVEYNEYIDLWDGIFV